MVLVSSGSSSTFGLSTSPLKFTPYTDIKMSVIADSAQGVTANCSFRGWLDPII